jgi:hypothetical protein
LQFSHIVHEIMHCVHWQRGKGLVVWSKDGKLTW